MSDRAQEAVNRIVEDILDRRGLKHEWRQIDADIRSEIKTVWEHIIDEVMTMTTYDRIAAVPGWEGLLDEGVAPASPWERLGRLLEALGKQGTYWSMASGLRNTYQAYALLRFGEGMWAVGSTPLAALEQAVAGALGIGQEASSEPRHPA